LEVDDVFLGQLVVVLQLHADRLQYARTTDEFPRQFQNSNPMIHYKMILDGTDEAQ
jgi:hypothetical protein